MMENNVSNEIKKTEKPSESNGIFGQYLTYVDRGRFGLKEKILFFKELSYLLKGGLSLVECMNIIRSGTNNHTLKNVAGQISGYLRRGKSLSLAFNRLPQYFSPGDYYILKAGEMSGNMPNVLQSLSSEYQFLNDIKSKYISALIYPVLLVLVAIIAVFALFIFVLPSVFALADSFQGIKLPWATQFLRDFSMFFQYHWKAVLMVVGVVVLFGFVIFSSDSGKRYRYDILFKMPLIGKMTKYFYLVKWCRYMKLMNSSGMNYVQTFQLLRDILGIPAYNQMITNVLAGLQKGEMIYTSIKNEKSIIPNDVVVLVKVGEETANLSNSLDNVLVLYEGELMDMINRLSKIIEPIMLIFIGGIVTIIALGVFGLIMQIMEGAGI